MEASGRYRRARVIDIATEGRGYYAWTTRQVVWGEQSYTVCTKPGMLGHHELDPAMLLLAEKVGISPVDRTLTLNCGAGLVGAAAAARCGEGRVTIVETNLVALEAARRTMAANGFGGAALIGDQDWDGLALEGALDRVAARLPKGRSRIREILWQAFQALKPGGLLYMGGGKREGIKSGFRLAGQLFGEFRVVAYRKGYQIGVGEKREGPLPADSWVREWLDRPAFHVFPVEIHGREVQICSRPGIFSWDRLDPGTELLLETMEIAPNDRVLDLGCGYGVIGMAAAGEAYSGSVMLVDADFCAVSAARQTLAANQVGNARVLAGDCASLVEDALFDVVAANPPFHQGAGTDYEVALQFILDAARVLKPGGRLYLVANQFIPYEQPLQAAFRSVRERTRNGGYKVLLAEGPRK